MDGNIHDASAIKVGKVRCNAGSRKKGTMPTFYTRTIRIESVRGVETFTCFADNERKLKIQFLSISL
jgi:hypothetical protein